MIRSDEGSSVDVGSDCQDARVLEHVDIFFQQLAPDLGLRELLELPAETDPRLRLARIREVQNALESKLRTLAALKKVMATETTKTLATNSSSLSCPETAAGLI